MIRKISLKNFQCHTERTLEFSQGVNIITGSSDNGKSAIVRALNWVLFNRPTGFSFRTEGSTKGTSVSVETDRGTVTRFRDDKENYYLVGKEKFKALKGEVPEEVKKILNIPEESVQNQFDPHFMFHFSPGEVAKMFNDKAPGLKDIDPLLTEANRFVLELTRKSGDYTEQIEDLGEQIEELTWTKSFSKELKKVVSLNEEFVVLNEDVVVLKQYLSEIKTLKEKLGKYTKIDKLEKSLLSVEKSLDRLRIKKERCDLLKQTSSQIQHTQKQLQIAKGVVMKEAELREANKLYKILTEIDRKAKILRALIDSYKGKSKKLLTTEEELKTLTEKVKELQKKAKICPVCGKAL